MFIAKRVVVHFGLRAEFVRREILRFAGKNGSALDDELYFWHLGQ